MAYMPELSSVERCTFFELPVYQCIYVSIAITLAKQGIFVNLYIWHLEQSI